MKPRSFEIDRRQIREMLSHPIPDANGRDTREVRDTQPGLERARQEPGDGALN